MRIAHAHALDDQRSSERMVFNTSSCCDHPVSGVRAKYQRKVVHKNTRKVKLLSVIQSESLQSRHFFGESSLAAQLLLLLLSVSISS